MSNSDLDHLLLEYFTLCKQFNINPDGGMICALKTKQKVLKPGISYNENNFYVLMSFLILLTKKYPSLLSFNKFIFTDGKIGSNGALILSEFLRYDKNIHSIRIINNKIGPRGAYSLASVFTNGYNTTLYELNLHGNRILYKGALALSKAIQLNNNSLQILDVSNNHIGFEGVLKLQFAVNKINNNRKALNKKKNKQKEIIPLLHINTNSNFVIEETWNSISHGIGLFLSILATIAMGFHASNYGTEKLLSSMVYCFSLILLYACSSLYHSFFKLGTTKDIFQRLDHAGIFILIAGSYTPVIWGGPLDGFYGRILLLFVWFIAFMGILLVCFWFDKYPVLELSLYLAMGWVSVGIAPVVYYNWESFVSGDVVHINGLLWYLLGGIIYTIGVYFFLKGVRIPIHHAVWHVFVVAASLCHYIGCYIYIIPTYPPEIPFW